MANHFHKIGRQYYLTDYIGILLQTMQEIGLVFRILGDEVELIKYGDAMEVRDYYYLHCKEGETYFIRSKFTDLDKINKLLSDEKYATVFYNELKQEFTR